MPGTFDSFAWPSGHSARGANPRADSLLCGPGFSHPARIFLQAAPPRRPLQNGVPARRSPSIFSRRAPRPFGLSDHSPASKSHLPYPRAIIAKLRTPSAGQSARHGAARSASVRIEAVYLLLTTTLCQPFRRRRLAYVAQSITVSLLDDAAPCSLPCSRHCAGLL